jgi:hypothetical protein
MINKVKQYHSIKVFNITQSNGSTDMPHSIKLNYLLTSESDYEIDPLFSVQIQPASQIYGCKGLHDMRKDDLSLF